MGGDIADRIAPVVAGIPITIARYRGQHRCGSICNGLVGGDMDAFDLAVLLDGGVVVRADLDDFVGVAFHGVGGAGKSDGGTTSRVSGHGAAGSESHA